MPTASLYANPQHVRDPAPAAEQLAEVLPELSPAELRAKLAGGRSFVWLQRNLTPRPEYAVNALGIPGLYFQREQQRFYPHGRSEERRVGKECVSTCRSRWSPVQYKKKNYTTKTITSSKNCMSRKR